MPPQEYLCHHCRSYFDRSVKAGNIIYWRQADGTSERWAEKYSLTAMQEVEWYPHWPTFSNFMKSAFDGCHICALFLSQVSPNERDIIKTYEPKYVKWRALRIGVQDSANRAIGRYDLRLLLPILDIWRKQRSDLGCYWLLQMRPTQVTSCAPSQLCLKTDSFQILEIATSWIMSCIVNHPMCTHTRTGLSHIPSRLIAIGSCDDFSDVHLCLGSEIQPDFQYITLSHSWGGDIPVMLTTDLEQEYQRQIPWDPLPQTFKDAIKVARKLRIVFGVQYIWIDALCILQGCSEDWHKEGRNMCDIYSFSFCNFAACIGPNSSWGLFRDRDSFSSHTCIVQAQIDDKPASFFEVENCQSLRTDIERSELGSRAWVLQEILLAQRVLYFAPQRIFWECGSLCAQEGAPSREMICSSIQREILHSREGLTVSGKERLRSEDADYRLYRKWMNMVHNYTGRRLTRSSDKLVAISGLAKHIAASLANKDVYILGLWKRNLLLHLVWKVSYGQRTSRPEPYRAPSWSWASVDGTIYNHRTNQDAVEHTSALAKIEDLQIDYVVPEDPYGQVKSAQIFLQGRLIRVGLDLPPAFATNGGELAKLNWQGESLMESLGGPGLARLDILMSAQNIPPSAYFMPLVDEKYDSPASPRQGDWIGLVLQPVQGSRGTYERFATSEVGDKGRRAFQQAENSMDLSEEEYLSNHGNGIYTICIM